jgi:hypothetical protein
MKSHARFDPSSPEEVKAKLVIIFNEPNCSVSTVYSFFIRPFCDLRHPYSDALFPENQPLNKWPSLLKIPLLLYQAMARPRADRARGPLAAR